MHLNTVGEAQSANILDERELLYEWLVMCN